MKNAPLTQCIVASAVLAILFPASIAFAAQIHVAAPTSPVGTGDAFIIPITFDAQGDRVNAIQGTLVYPQNLLRLTEIRDGNSVLNLWVERPQDLGGVIRFAGVTPGGLTSNTGEIFSLVFEARKAGKVQFDLTDAKALRNDGLGTELSVRLNQKPFALTAKGTGLTVISLRDNDKTAPEPFAVSVSSDPNVFDGKTFITFATQDKDSGIDHYEVAEKLGFQRFAYDSLTWEIVESPYVLSDESLSSYVYVRAVDRAGNPHVAVLSPAHLPFYYNTDALFVILILAILLLGSSLYAFIKNRQHVREPTQPPSV